MMFSMIRLAFGGIAFLVIFALIRWKKTTHRRRWSVVAFVAVILIITITALVPIENMFITWHSLESAYSYNHTGNISIVVSGEKSDFVVGKEAEVDAYTIIPKKADGWSLGMGTDINCIFQTTSDGIDISVYRYKKSDDYYIVVFNANGGTSDIMDNRDSVFQYSETVIEALDETFYTYYAYVRDFNDQYSITIDDRTIEIRG